MLRLSREYRASRESAASFDATTMQPYRIVTQFEMQPISDRYLSDFTRAKEIAKDPAACTQSRPTA